MQADTLLVLGALFLLGLVVEGLGRYTRLPRVTMLILLGMAVGPVGVGLIPREWQQHFSWLSSLALTMVGFLLGGKLAGLVRQGGGGRALRHSLVITLVTFAIVALLLGLLGVPPLLAVLLAGVSLATDPAATLEVAQPHAERSYFARLLLGIVALDDAWGLLLFAVLLASLDLWMGVSNGATPLLHAAREVLGAVALGVALGVPLSWAAGRVRRGEATTVEALAIVFLCCGLSLWLGVSFILAAMVTGFVVALTARRPRQPFHEIAHLEWPVLLVFFIMVGASLDPAALLALGWTGAVYVVARILGRLAGGLACLGDPQLPAAHRPWLGLSLLPQAGVAIGVALMAAQRYPEVGSSLLAVITAAVVLFELLGPVLTRRALATVAA